MDKSGYATAFQATPSGCVLSADISIVRAGLLEAPGRVTLCYV